MTDPPTDYVLDPTFDGARRLEVDMGKIGVDNLTDLAKLAALRRHPILASRMHDYRWIHTHVCEYLKQFHPADNQVLLEQALTADWPDDRPAAEPEKVNPFKKAPKDGKPRKSTRRLP